ncbi:MAG TPA: hypothetical protein VMF89_34810 [Polyangiales bacterium]|nr:hypothetical protein [Polyangiales bacterium]
MRSAWLCCLVLLTGCSLETAGRGQRCQRTAQCALGFACVEGRCSTDLRSIAEGNTVPNLNAGTGGAAGASGAAGEAGSVSDSAGAGGSEP